MDLQYRKLWISDNGRYKVLIRKFKGDPSVLVGFWKIDNNGKNENIRYKSLPSYVKAKIEELKSEVN